MSQLGSSRSSWFGELCVCVCLCVGGTLGFQCCLRNRWADSVAIDKGVRFESNGPGNALACNIQPRVAADLCSTRAGNFDKVGRRLWPSWRDDDNNTAATKSRKLYQQLFIQPILKQHYRVQRSFAGDQRGGGGAPCLPHNHLSLLLSFRAWKSPKFPRATPECSAH